MRQRAGHAVLLLLLLVCAERGGSTSLRYIIVRCGDQQLVLRVC
jgi:hypothetical protein